MKKFVNKKIDLRNFGCAVYALLLMACGMGEGYIILSTHEWDVAAGFLLVEEAGGKVTGIKGEKYDLGKNEFVVSNGKLHNEILAHLK